VVRRLVFLLALCVVASLSTPADACACCDASTHRNPVGWTEAGGAILIEMTTNAGCSNHHVLEVWPVGASSPSGCYDVLADDPDKRNECELTDHERSAKVKTSSQLKRFPRAATALDPKLVRLSKRRLMTERASLEVTVEVLTSVGWRRVLRTTIDASEMYGAANGADVAVPVSVTIWPNARGDRAALLIENEDVSPGTGNWATTVRWIELPAGIAPGPR
jgi:hypothetical protein